MVENENAESRPWLAIGLEVARVLENVDGHAIAEVTHALKNTDRRWFFSGQGRSALVAQMAAMRFMHLGFQVHVVGEVTAPSVQEGDGILIISGSGETPISLSFAKIAQKQKALVISITCNPRGSLAANTDIMLQVPVEKTEQFGGSLFEQTSLLLLDSIVLGISNENDKAHEGMALKHTNFQ